MADHKDNPPGPRVGTGKGLPSGPKVGSDHKAPKPVRR